MDEELIGQAKEYAEKRGKSVSRIVADYFRLLEQETQEEEEQLSPLTRSLKGSIPDSGPDEEAYRRHLEEKHR